MDLEKAFILKSNKNYLDPIKVTLRENVFDASQLKLFTHVISHEYHHKGQILSLSRHLGYVPADTDVIR